VVVGSKTLDPLAAVGGGGGGGGGGGSTSTRLPPQ